MLTKDEGAADHSQRGEVAGAVTEAGLNHFAMGLLIKDPKATKE
jgi:hypothetical protein